MDISIIIVNFRVPFFLEQCLSSVEKALATLGNVSSHETIVVDNDPEHVGMDWLRSRFPQVKFLEHSQNLGFGKACNQGFLLARGDYLLFLNPDCLVPENLPAYLLDWMREHPDCGAAGVRMIDGGGRYLPESRRGFPSPRVSFFRMTGLSACFPRSAFFARYYLGHLPTDKNGETEILSGACFLATRSALVQTGGFDEQFFLYAEDIDLSWRIRQLGLANHYLASVTVLHFKGESSDRDLQHIRHFYGSMRQFYQKYYPNSWNHLSGRLIRGAILLSSWIARAAQIPERWPGKKGPSFPHPRYFLAGDPQTCQSMNHMLELMGKTLADSPESADQLIYCEGPGFSFRQLIETLNIKKLRIPVLVHAAGSRSVAGGRSGAKKGISWALSGPA